jgi:two-component system OmpR family sensor kinase
MFPMTKMTAVRPKSETETTDQGQVPRSGWFSHLGAWSARGRILVWALVLLAVSLFLSVVVIRQVLLVRLDERIDRHVTQEVDEFRQLVGGNDPATGQPFGTDVYAIFDVYFARNVPSEGEVVLGLVGGVPYKRTLGGPYPVDLLTEQVELWAAAEEPTREVVATPGGEMRYLAVPLELEGVKLGTFVVTNFPAQEQAEVEDAVQVAAWVSASVLVLASLAAWLATGRVLAPLRLLSDTARSIKDTDLTQRIPIRGNDELADLARTFNDMLDRLEAAFEAQRAFIDDAGHELRTPITIIRGHLEVVGQDPAERQEAREVILDELDRMARMVDELLLLAKSERADFLDVHPIDLAEFTAELAGKAKTLGDRRWVEEGSAALVFQGDRQRLTQAVMNLARNAVRHTTPDQVIAIGSSSVNQTVRLWVRDTGEGIDPADQKRIFERFAQGSAMGKGRSEDSGLGLAIVQAIVEAHGGRVELDSRPGHGAVFTLVLLGEGS